MNTFTDQCAQGDIFIRRIGSIPKEAVPQEAKGAYVVVTHSETGHDHVFSKLSGVRMFEAPNNPLLGYLSVPEAGATLEHLRPWDTHQSILFQPGHYEVRRQREWSPEGWRRVAD